MSYPVKLALYRNGELVGEFLALNEDDLRCPVEMDTGTGWLDAAPLYQKLLEKGCGQLTDTFRVCHSYQKWGSMQQEVVQIEVRVQGPDIS